MLSPRTACIELTDAPRRHMKRPGWRPCRTALHAVAEIPAFNPAWLQVLYTRSGRFYGTPAQQGFIQKSHHPGNNGHIRKVEDIPAKGKPPRINMEQHEIHDAGPMQAIDSVADCAADNQTQGCGSQPRLRPRQPGPEEDNCHDLEREEAPYPR